jgi:hypothetical protein
LTGESSGVNVSTAGPVQWCPVVKRGLGTAAPAARCVDSAGPTHHSQPTQTVPGRFVQEASNSPGHSASEPIEPRKTNPTKSPQGCSERIVGDGMAEPFSTRRRLSSTGKNWVSAPVGVPGVGEDGMVRQSSGERGKVSDPAKRVPAGTVRSYNREVGNRTAGPRLAAEDGVSDDARRNEPWPSQGPLGTSGSAAEEMAGTQRPGIISPQRAERRRWPTKHERCQGDRDSVSARDRLGIPPLTETHSCLSPDGGNLHVRWGGGGQETGP